MTSLLKKATLLFTLLVVTSLMVSGGVAQTLNEPTLQSVESDTTSSLPDSPYLNFPDSAHNPNTKTTLDFTYNATGNVSSASDLGLYVNNSSGTVLANKTSFSSLKGEETFTISSGEANSNTTLNLTLYNISSKKPIKNDSGFLVADSVKPELSNAKAIDRTDGNGNVSDGDKIEVKVDVSDSGGSGLHQVYVTNADDFGAEEPQYSKTLGTSVRELEPASGNTYNDTFKVDAANASSDGSYNLSIVALDYADNLNQTDTNALTLNTSSSGSDTYINGTVTNSSGHPLSGIGVEFEYAGPDNKDAGFVTTDSNGNYSFEVPDAGQDYEAIVNNDSYVFKEIGPISTESGKTTPVDITLEKADTFINGTVTNSSGDRLSGVFVQFEYADTGEFFKAVQTNQKGNYSFAVPNASRNYTAIINNESYLRETKDQISVTDKTTTTVNFTLSKGSVINGTVTNSSGAKVSNVRVYIVNSSTGSVAASPTTNSTGYYSARVSAGTYQLIVDDRAYEFKIKRNVTVPPSGTTVDLQLQEAPDPGYLNGTVETAGGTPVANATVQIHDESYNYFEKTTTSSDGNFSIRTPGTNYTVRVEPGGSPTNFPPQVIDDVSVPENGETHVTVTVEQPGYISGVVKNSSGRVPGVTVVAETEEGVFVDRTDLQGRYNITASAGTHTVSVFARGQDAPSQTVTVTSGQTNTTNFTLRRTEVVSKSVEILSGNGDESKIEVRAGVNQGLLLVQLVNDSYPYERFGAPSELEGTGVDDSTKFRINVTVTNYTPSSLLWGINDANWTKTQNDSNPNATDITITGSPVTLQANFNKGPAAPLISKSPSEVNWPTGRNDQATNGRNETVYFGLFDLSSVPSEVRENLGGMSATTNAQRFSLPQVKNDSLRVWIAAPGLTVDGADHTGFYQATIPDSQLQEWNVTNPEKQLNALYKGNPANFTVTETSSGARIRIENISYSAGWVEVESTSNPPSISNASVDAGGDGIVTDGETVTVSANVSDSNDDIKAVVVNATNVGAGIVNLTDGDGDGEYDASLTADRTNAPDDGTYRLKIKANDSAGNVEIEETNAIELDVWYPPEDQILTQTEDVEIWERSVLPLRADTDQASVTIDNAFWYVNLQGEGTTSLNKDPFGVFRTGSDIPVSFDDDRAIATDELGYSEDPMDVKLVAARLETNGSVTLSNFDSTEDIKELLNGSAANENATFEAVSATQLDQNTGEASFTFTPDQSGQYVLLLASNESGSFVVENGNVSIDGQTTLLGVDQVMVQDGPSSVSTSSTVTAGDNISVDADTGSIIETGSNENVTHMVAVYDEETFRNQTFTLNVSEPFESISDNVTLEHSIKTVNGVWVVRNNVSLAGTDISETRREGRFAFSEVIDILTNGTGTDIPTKATGDTVFNSSATIVETDANGTIVVETNQTWPADEYRLVHFATNENGTQIAASKTTVQIEEPEPSNVTIANASVPVDQAFTNESVQVNVTLRNTGDLEGTKTVNVTVGNRVIASASASVPEDSNKTITTQVRFDTPGDKNIAVVDTDTGEEVTAGTVAVDSAIRVVNFSLNETTPTVGEPITVTTNIENRGPNSDSTDVTLVVEGVEQANTTSGTLAAGETATVNFTYTFTESGTQDVAVQTPGTGDFDTVDVSLKTIDLNITAVNPTNATIKTGESITFNVTRKNDSQPVENATVAVGTSATTLATNTTAADGTVTFTLNTSGDFAAVAAKEPTADVEYTEDSVNVTVNAPANISVVDVAALSDPAYTGDTLTVETTVENVGDLSGEKNLTFTFAGRTIETRSVTVDGSTTRVIAFEVTPQSDDVGNQTVDVNGTTDTVTVKEAAIATGFTPLSDTIASGDTLTVDATIKNRGSSNSTIDVNLTIDGTEVANQTGIKLTPGEEQTRSLTWDSSGQPAGTVNVSVNGLANQTVTVERQSIPLRITADPSSAITNETVTFTVERTDGDSATPVSNANISVNGKTLTTNASGQNATSFAVADTYTATASKGQNATATFESDSVTVTINEPANLTVVDTFLETTQAYVGDDVNVSATVENTGGVSGTRTVNLTNGTGVVDSASVTVDPGGQSTVTLTTTVNETRNVTLTAGNLTAGTVTVDAQSVVTGFTLNATAVQTNSDVNITATVENRGETADDDGLSVTFYKNNSTDTASFTKTSSSIGAGSTTTVSQVVTLTDDVTYNLSVEDLEPQSVTVSDNVVNLNLTLENSTPVLTGTELVFNVTREDNDTAVDATVEVAGESLSTGSDGLASTTIDEAGSYRAVASKADEGGETFNSDSVTFTVEDDANLVVTDAYRRVTQAYVNDTVTIEAVVENTGDRSGKRKINLTVGGTERNNTTVSLAGGSSKTVVLSTTFDEGETGTQTLVVSGTTAGDVEIDPQTVVTDFTLNTTSVTVGDTVRVNASVRNRGTTADDDFGLNVTYGDQNASRTVSVPAGTTQFETFDLTFSSPGTVDVAVEDLDAQTVTVSRDLVDLSIAATPTIAATGEQVTFTVTDEEDNPVKNASIAVGQQTLTTNSNGNASTNFSQTGTYSAQVEKESTSTESFGTDSTSIEIRAPGNTRVIDTDLVTSTPIYAGENVTVEVDLLNDGGITDNRTVRLNNSTSQLNSTEVQLAPGASTTVRLTAQFNASDTESLRINGDRVENVTIEEAAAVTDFSLSQDALTTGDTLTVKATVKNRGGTTDSVTANLTVDGSVVDSQSVKNLEAGNTTTVDLTTSFDTNGTRTVSVNGVRTESVSVALSTAQLELTANTTSLPAGKPVQFTVTSGGNPVNATVALGDSRIGVMNGTATTSIRVAGDYTATATKAANDTTAFGSDTVSLSVTDPIATTTSVSYGSVQASPVETDDRPNSATATRTVTITNQGGRSVALSSAEIVGADADQFAIASSFPSSVPAGSSRTVTVAFEPTVRQSASATLRFKSDTPNKPTRKVSLTGTGEAPAIEVNTTSLTFGDVGTGSSATQTVRINNTGDRNLTLTAAPMGNGFSRSNSSLTITPDSSKNITVTFAPTAARQYGAPLTLSPNDPFKDTVTVRATGTGLGGEIDVSPNPGSGADYDFGDVTVNENETTRIYVESTGTQAINVTPSMSGSAFSVENDSDTITLAPDDSRFLTVTVSPQTASPTGDLTISTNTSTTKALNFTADTLTPTAQITPEPGVKNLTFGGVAVGGSTTESVTIQNTGNATLSVDRTDAIPNNEPFTLGGTSNLSVPAGETQTLSVTFTPSVPQDANAKLTLETNDPNNGSVTINLTGEGEATRLTGNASSVDFGTVGRDGSETRTVTLRNDGTENLTRLRVRSKTGSGAGQFAVVTSTFEVLEPGESTDVSVRFDPTAAGTHAATITFAASGEVTGRNTFAVSVSGEATPPEVAVDTQQVRFGYVNAQAGDSANDSVEVTNVGRPATQLTVTDVTVSGGAFSVTNSPTGTTINGSESLDVDVEFDPSTQGRQTATLTITTDAPEDATREVELTGVGAAPDAAVSTRSIDFGEVRTGTQSGQRTVTITNEGGATLTLENASVSSDQFTIADGLDQNTLVPGATEQVAVAAAPDATGSQTANLTITTDGGDRNVSLAANGIAPNLTVTQQLNGTFGQVRVGSSARNTLVVENTGNATLILNEPTISGADSDAFTVVSGDASLRLGAGETATYAVAFTPTDDVSTTGRFSLTSASGQSTDTSLSGTGTQADASLSPSTVDFGTVPTGDSESTTVTLTNDGGAGLDVTGVSVTGADAASFSVSGVTTGTIPSGENTTFTVSTSPSVRGSVSAQLAVETRQEGTLTATLGATATEPDIQLQRGSIAFDRTRLGETDTATLEISNGGNAELNVTSIAAAGANPGKFALAESQVTVPAQSTEEVTVRFQPSGNVSAALNGTPQTATLVLQTNDPDESTVRASLSGTAKTPVLTGPESVQFGATAIGDTSTRNVTITNDVSASASVTLETISIAGSDEYTVSKPSDRTLSPGESASLPVQLTPVRPGSKFAVLLITTNDPRQPGKVVFLSNTETIVRTQFGSVDVTYRNVDPGQQPQTTFRRGLSRNASMIAAQPAVTTDDDFGLHFESQQSPFGATAVSSDKIKPLRYVSITKQNLTASELQNSSLQFRVSKSAVAAAGVPKDRISLFKYNTTTGTYDDIEATLVREERTNYIYESTTQSLSRFTIGITQQADINIIDTSLSPTTITTDETATVTVKVENTGGASGTITLDLTVDGSTVKTKSKTVASGATETVTFDVSRSTAATYSIGVNGQSVGSLTVEQPSTPTPTPTPAPGDGDDDEPAVTTPAGTPAPGPVSATAQLDETGAASIELSGGAAPTSISVSVPETTGQVNVQELPEPPADVPEPAGRYVTGVDIDAPDPPEGQTATVSVTVAQSRLNEMDVTAEELVIQHYRDGAWRQLDTEVSTSGNQVTLTAPVTGFSPFAVTTREQVTTTAPPETTTTTETTTPPETTTTAPGTTPTETPEGPADGFPIGPVVVVLVLLAAAGYLLYQRS